MPSGTKARKIRQEVQEETGFSAEVGSLLAIFDTNRFQLQNKQYAKFVFDCQLLDGQFQENQEVAELGFFDLLGVVWCLNLH